MNILQSLDVWDSAAQNDQDRAIQSLTELLADDFEISEQQLYSCGDQRHYGAAWTHRSSKVVFQLITGGARKVYDGFVSEDEEKRQVAPFLMSRFPVTNKIWDRGLETITRDSDHHPKVGISPKEIEDWLERGPIAFRLPNENEWEQGTWSGTDKRFFWGDNPDPRYYWYDKNGEESLHSVYEHEAFPNAFGLVDTLGHVWELCAEGHGSGGCLWSHGYSFDLQLDPPLRRMRNLGFRLACSLNLESSIQ